MKTFQWSSLFETGLTDVDAQHQRLVALVNDLADSLDGGEPEHIDATLTTLAEYTVYHFQCEEDLMDAAGVDQEHAQRHRETHRQFVQQVTDWMAQRHSAGQISLPQLLDYLANWLVFHILGDDQSLGRQVAAIRSGCTAHTAFLTDTPSDDPRTVILLGGLRRLYSDLIERNEKLMDAQQSLTQLNETLEQRVRDRTAALQAANAQIHQEQDRVVEAEKMASLGRMVAGFAHEVNTPVGVAVGAVSQANEVVKVITQLLQHDEVTEEELNQQLLYLHESNDLAMSNLKRAAALVQSFKRTAIDQSSELEREYLLDELIADVVYNLRPIFKRSPIAITVNCPANLRLSGIPGALTQVLTNLCLNAHAHAFDDGNHAGHLDISVAVSGTTVEISVADDGVGMDETSLKKAFEPFYTTRRNRGGSGLGLYIAYNLVMHKLGGSLVCTSEPGQGVRLLICLPYHAAPEMTSLP
jgi:hemerythrin-like metal-binding protein